MFLFFEVLFLFVNGLFLFCYNFNGGFIHLFLSWGWFCSQKSRPPWPKSCVRAWKTYSTIYLTKKKYYCFAMSCPALQCYWLGHWNPIIENYYILKSRRVYKCTMYTYMYVYNTYMLYFCNSRCISCFYEPLYWSSFHRWHSGL